ncbi:hypothetical protein [Novilysobacter spongiicola]|uniref:Sulfation-dependent quorum factor, Ax21 family n=1 Tax=Lysobacter spongiicola DSM 21749 TaxID=1122188 RepID=A0A1T4Q6J6_9GAMM|nr:hypothetical protein [Lysobacter spongiicola]SJZ99326.1 sulfation-dependent quorum factor, Ax21 family [Lysobacter spongiicola DSM 21749]
MKKSLAAALLLAIAPFAANADGIAYNYVEAGYAHVDLEGETGDGFQLRGSAAVSQSLYLFGGYSSVEGDDFDVELEEGQFGLGVHTPVGERADFIAEIGYLRHDIEIGGLGSATLDGGRVSAGFRGMAGDNLEGWVKASYNDGGDLDGSLSGLVGVQFKFNPTWGIFAEIESGELVEDADTTKYMVGVRASF